MLNGKTSVTVIFSVLCLLYAVNAQTISDRRLLTYFSLNGTAGEIEKTTHPDDPYNTYIIKVVFPYEIDLEGLIADFKTQAGTSVFVNKVRQMSGVTKNDFSGPVTYMVKNNTGDMQEYTVRVSFDPEFVLDFGGTFHPSYNTTYKMLNIGIDGDLFIGGKFDNFIIGAEASDSFYIFNGQSGGNNISGYWNIIRGALANRILLSRYWGLQWGIGGSWIYSSFEYKNYTRYIRSNPGLFLTFDVLYSPLPYLRLAFFNQFDLFINMDNGDPFQSGNNFYPYYRGGIRVNFLTFVKWLRIHFAVSGLYSYYKENSIETTFGVLIFDAGLHFDLQFPSMLKGPLPGNQSGGAEKQIAGIGIQALRAAKANDLIEFPGIVFKKNSNELTKESYSVLDDISQVLRETPRMEISLKIYAKRGADPVRLLAVSVEKAKIIKKYLAGTGIEAKRISIPSQVSIIPDNYTDKEFLIRILVLKTE